jgi:hypothetical protein
MYVCARPLAAFRLDVCMYARGKNVLLADVDISVPQSCTLCSVTAGCAFRFCVLRFCVLCSHLALRSPSQPALAPAARVAAFSYCVPSSRRPTRGEMQVCSHLALRSPSQPALAPAARVAAFSHCVPSSELLPATASPAVCCLRRKCRQASAAVCPR